jgi:hypothetical protein
MVVPSTLRVQTPPIEDHCCPADHHGPAIRMRVAPVPSGRGRLGAPVLRDQAPGRVGSNRRPCGFQPRKAHPDPSGSSACVATALLSRVETTFVIRRDPIPYGSVRRALAEERQNRRGLSHLPEHHSSDGPWLPRRDYDPQHGDQGRQGGDHLRLPGHPQRRLNDRLPLRPEVAVSQAEPAEGGAKGSPLRLS